MQFHSCIRHLYALLSGGTQSVSAVDLFWSGEEESQRRQTSLREGAREAAVRTAAAGVKVCAVGGL